MPKTMTISLPDEMRAYVEERTRAGSYASSSEFIRQLVREDQKRLERERLEQMLLEGLDGGPPIRANDAYWQDLRRRVEQRAGAGKTTTTRKAGPTKARR